MQLSVGAGLRRHALHVPEMPLVPGGNGTEVARQVRTLTFPVYCGGCFGRRMAKDAADPESRLWAKCNEM